MAVTVVGKIAGGGAEQPVGTTDSPTFANLDLTPPGALRNAGQTGTFVGFRRGGSATDSVVGIGIASTANHFEFNNGVGLSIIAARCVGWRLGNNDGDAVDTALSRVSAGLAAVGTGAAGDFAGALKLTRLVTAPLTFATLPASPSQGARCLITDATSTVFATLAATGGANVMPVFYDGTNWKIG